MAKFLIEFPRTTDDCVYTLHDLAKESPDVYARMNWACMVDKNAGWGFVEAENVAAVKSLLPPDLQEKVAITLVTPYNEEDIRARTQVGQP
ncbi:MAG: hypothetical protein WCT06_06470 [Armatimonadota bacterium]|jgi:hypothetical protein|nr:hypothetical protein [Armatimonadota bacterium]